MRGERAEEATSASLVHFEVDRATPAQDGTNQRSENAIISPGRASDEIKSLKNRFERSSSARHITLEVRRSTRRTSVSYRLADKR